MLQTRLVLGAALAALALAVSSGRAGHHDEAFQQCARACGECARICEACADHCARLVAEGKKDHLKTLRTCQDCATHCAAAARIMARQGPFSDLICTACAEACARCGKACEGFPDDAMMKKCAEECRKCEKECRKMLEHLGKRSAERK
jgi:hypothetical protein